MTRGTVIEVDFISRRRVAARPRGFHAFRQGAQKPVVGFAPFKVIEGGRLHSEPPPAAVPEKPSGHQRRRNGEGPGAKGHGIITERGGRDCLGGSRAGIGAPDEHCVGPHHLDPFALAAVVSRLVRNLAEQQATGGDLGSSAVGKQGRLFREGDAIEERDLFSERAHLAVPPKARAHEQDQQYERGSDDQAGEHPARNRHTRLEANAERVQHLSVLHHCDCEECEKAAGGDEGD